jgi:catechol 2,3-dioxygenase-like lactoylglutathione lyase family enzyme
MSDVWFEGLSLPVTELDASSGFYVALGFTVEIRTPQFCLLRFGSGTLGLLQVGQAALNEGGRRQLRSLIQVELGTDDLDALYAEFLARDVPVHVPPRDRGFERSMQLRDPDGFTVEFAEGVRGHNSTATPRS